MAGRSSDRASNAVPKKGDELIIAPKIAALLHASAARSPPPTGLPPETSLASLGVAIGGFLRDGEFALAERLAAFVLAALIGAKPDNWMSDDATFDSSLAQKLQRRAKKELSRRAGKRGGRPKEYSTEFIESVKRRVLNMALEDACRPADAYRKIAREIVSDDPAESALRGQRRLDAVAKVAEKLRSAVNRRR